MHIVEFNTEILETFLFSTSQAIPTLLSTPSLCHFNQVATDYDHFALHTELQDQLNLFLYSAPPKA